LAQPSSVRDTRRWDLGKCWPEYRSRPKLLARRHGPGELLSVTEHYKMIFRAEAFNLFNRALYGQPSASFDTASFGHITSVISTTGLVGTRTPRQMEFALRHNFQIPLSQLTASDTFTTTESIFTDRTRCISSHHFKKSSRLFFTIGSLLSTKYGDFDHLAVDLKRNHLFVSAEVHHFVEI
jgi:hypothetical protein